MLFFVTLRIKNTWVLLAWFHNKLKHVWSWEYWMNEWSSWEIDFRGEYSTDFSWSFWAQVAKQVEVVRFITFEILKNVQYILCFIHYFSVKQSWTPCLYLGEILPALSLGFERRLLRSWFNFDDKMFECLRISTNYFEFYYEKLELFKVFCEYLEMQFESNLGWYTLSFFVFCALKTHSFLNLFCIFALTLCISVMLTLLELPW